MGQRQEEINTWVELYSKPLLDRALSLVSNKEDAMDLVQEVFISASAALSSFEGKSSPLTWLNGILKNKIADFYRSRYRTPQIFSMSEFFDQAGSWVDGSVTHLWPMDSDEVDESELIEILQSCISHLPAQWQITVKLYYMEEKKTNDVCQELEISSSNLWKILQRSRLQLRKCIELNWVEKL